MNVVLHMQLIAKDADQNLLADAHCSLDSEIECVAIVPGMAVEHTVWKSPGREVAAVSINLIDNKIDVTMAPGRDDRVTTLDDFRTMVKVYRGHDWNVSENVNVSA